jgi:hypothetical protein
MNGETAVNQVTGTNNYGELGKMLKIISKFFQQVHSGFHYFGALRYTAAMWNELLRLIPTFLDITNTKRLGNI